LAHLQELGTSAWTHASAVNQRAAALSNLQRAVSSSQFGQVAAVLESLAAAMRAADIAWDSLTMVLAAAQRWASAAARETMAAGLITRPGDVLYLELEELKQVATGEWHAGDQAEVQAAVAGRLREVSAPPRPRPASPVTVSPGACASTLYCDSPRDSLPPAGVAWHHESADAGSAPFWGFAACVTTTAADPWSPGMVAARGLGVPARVGVQTGEV
jgi:hypothetical protein